MKKTITLEAIDPIEIYGAGNRILEEFCTYFPGLKVVARGNQLMLEGKPTQIEEFGMRLGQLIERRHQRMNLTAYDVEDIFDGETSPDKFRTSGDAIIVHATDGKPIRARGKTQQELVKAYFENDLIFAIGPAGTGKSMTVRIPRIRKRRWQAPSASSWPETRTISASSTKKRPSETRCVRSSRRIFPGRIS